MMTPDRRGLSLKIAASMLRPRFKDDEPPTPEALVRYAAVLDEFLYHGTIPEGDQVNVIGESPNVDFVQRLLRMADEIDPEGSDG